MPSLTTRIRSGNLQVERAALELGHVSMNWARIEGMLGEFICYLAALEEGAISHVFDGNTDLRNKIQIAKGLVYVRHYDKEWLATALALLDHIDTNLRARRNGVIHAEWFTPNRRLMRRTRKTKIFRPQAFQLQLETEQNIPVRMRDLRQLNEDLRNAWFNFLPVFWYMVHGDEGHYEPPPSQPIPWRRYLRLAGFRDPLTHVRAIQRRPRGSSGA